MVIGIFGESCVGKSTLADALQQKLGGTVITGKDYLRLAKNEEIAKKLFQKQLAEAVSGENVYYVISERPHLDLLPEGSLRILVTAELDTILTRFTARMHGNLPAPVKQMLERKHGCFDNEQNHIHVQAETMDLESIINQINGGVK